MKRIICVILCIAIFASLAACGSSEKNEIPTDNKKIASESPAPSEETANVFKWPKSQIAKLIPAPKSNLGEVYWEASYGFVIYVDGMTKDEYSDYVDTCMDEGFIEDYRRGDDYFYANNAEGYHLALKYEDDGRIFIRLDEPDEEVSETPSETPIAAPVATPTEEPKETPAAKPDDDTKTNASSEPVDENEVRDVIKNALDEYEAFIDEYVEFMEKYNSSDNKAKMMTEYLEYLDRFTDAMEAIEVIDDYTLTNAEWIYYYEVLARVSEKISKAS